MSMGFIIFLITIAFSLFSALGDKQHEKRQQQQPPRPKKHVETPEKGFFEKVQETLSEIEEAFSEQEPDTEKPVESPRQQKPIEEPKRPEVVQTEHTAEPTVSSRRKDGEQQRQRLNDMVAERMNQLDNELHRERQKQLARVERRARMIIEDEYLSNRTKQIKLKALMDTTNVKNASDRKMAFSDNEVINGVIWSEILNKPKQL
ncbi:hypothetical protein MUA48_05760 [Staphylococcus sp. IVB6238]|uniref:hypothetical protein n=1 Tax=Staphylococcus sp. IVB6238 TaxID=2989770 RepID=UPI0021D3067F|nr:hypothetical protein [Staphylococcus sp. IVB6238]UXR72933.1 hypothetical protein MUA48_05760 [Staphylococcus sp. IVB6238]